MPSSLFSVKVQSGGPFMRGEVPQKVVVSLYRALRLAANSLKKSLADNTPVGVYGKLKSAWKISGDSKEPSVSLSNDTKYFPWVENGRRPGPAPVRVMELWVRKKLGLAGDEATRVAFAICRKKAKQFTPGQKFASKTVESQRDKIIRNLKALVGKEISIEVQ